MEKISQIFRNAFPKEPWEPKTTAEWEWFLEGQEIIRGVYWLLLIVCFGLLLYWGFSTYSPVDTPPWFAAGNM